MSKHAKTLKRREEKMVKLIERLSGRAKTIIDGEGFNFPLLRTLHQNGGVAGSESLMERDPDFRRKVMRQKKRKISK